MTKKLTAVLLLICLALLPVCSLADGTLNVMLFPAYQPLTAAQAGCREAVIS